MNDIDKLPVKCRDCPYWELASYPWCCGDCTEKMNPKNSEYIKRGDAKRALTALSADLDAETVQRCIEAMNNPKAADVEPARHGRWIPGKAVYSKYDGGHIIARYYDRWTCSVCNYVINDQHYSRISYKRCPECGAKMDAELPKEEPHD